MKILHLDAYEIPKIYSDIIKEMEKANISDVKIALTVHAFFLSLDMIGEDFTKWIQGFDIKESSKDSIKDLLNGLRINLN